MKNKYTKVLVTGGAGFIGSHVVDQLVKHGYRVVVVDSISKKKGWINAKARYYHLDIRSSRLKGVFVKEKPQAVIHLAAHIEDRLSVRQPIMNAENNLIGLLNVFENCRHHKVKRIIFASSGIVYGEQKKFPVDEKAVPWPLTPYAISKLVGEHYLNFYSKIIGLPGLALRLANVYGPRQDGRGDSGVLAIFSEKMLKKQQPIVNNDGKTTRDYVYVGDVARAFVLALESNYVGELNISTGRETSTLEIFKIIKALTKSDCKLVFNPKHSDAVRRVCLNPKLAARTIKWKAKASLKDGVRATVAWFKARL
jgi:UDP-glucose 4-epimerase